MRTTAVYGNGKFGIADPRSIGSVRSSPIPFRAEMLTVYLIRAVHCRPRRAHGGAARRDAGSVTLAPALRRRFGIGNATGLGMAPFLVRHPALIDRWVAARETALARSRAAVWRRAASAGLRPCPAWRRICWSPPGRQTIPCRRRASRAAADLRAPRGHVPQARSTGVRALGSALPLGGGEPCRSRARR